MEAAALLFHFGSLKGPSVDKLRVINGCSILQHFDAQFEAVRRCPEESRLPSERSPIELAHRVRRGPMESPRGYVAMVGALLRVSAARIPEGEPALPLRSASLDLDLNAGGWPCALFGRLRHRRACTIRKPANPLDGDTRGQRGTASGALQTGSP